MAYKRISGRNTEVLERNLEDVVYGGSMKGGTHQATIKEITINDTYASVEFINPFEESIRHNFFYHNFDKTDTSYLLKQLIASVCEDANELFQYQDDPTQIKDLEGRQVAILVEGTGLRYTKTAGGFKAGRYEAPDLTSLIDMLQQDGLKIYRNNVTEVHAYDSTQASTDKATTRKDTGKTNNPRGKKLPSRLQF